MLNGFYAKSFEEELPNKDMFVSFMIDQVDVTQRLFANGFEGMEDCRTLYVAGALVDGFLEKVRKNKSLKQVELVVRDFTKVFVSPQQFRLFLKAGGRMRVLQKSKLIAVTVNPTSPSGYVLDSDTLCGKLSEAIGLPVYDLIKNKL